MLKKCIVLYIFFNFFLSFNAEIGNELLVPQNALKPKEDLEFIDIEILITLIFYKFADLTGLPYETEDAQKMEKFFSEHNKWYELDSVVDKAIKKFDGNKDYLEIIHSLRDEDNLERLILLYIYLFNVLEELKEDEDLYEEIQFIIIFGPLQGKMLNKKSLNNYFSNSSDQNLKNLEYYILTLAADFNQDNQDNMLQQ